MKTRQRPSIVNICMAIFLGLSSGVSLPEKMAAQTGDPVIVGAGDIANCSRTEDEATARLLDNIPGTVVTLGDNVYPDGKLTEFNTCYASGWGRHKSRTRPSAGNHDYHVAGAAGYYSYFGAAASPMDNNCTSNCRGYYSYNLGAWHIVVLNSQIDHGAGSAQELWLRADLAANPRECTLAYWHHPRFSSGSHGSQTDVRPFWQALYDYGADVVLSGHDHTYERFALQNPAGQAEPTRGIRQFVVGTGGASLYPWSTIQPNSQARNNTAHGVLKLTLHPTSYDWQFIPIAGQSFTDSGSANCVNAGPVASPPIATNLISPTGIVNTPWPIYRWNAVLGTGSANSATWYVFRLRKAGNILVHEEFFHAANICSGTTCAIQPAVSLTSTSYTWEVQAGNGLGAGPWSSPMSFQVVFPPGPAALHAPSGAITATNPTFSWNISADHATADPATWYYLWINGPSGKVLAEWYEASQVCNNSTCSVNPGVNLRGGAHRWWIRTWNKGGYGPWSPAMDFSLPLPDAPGAATLHSPSGSITDTTPTYSWDRVSASAWYYLWVSRVNADGTLTTVHTKWYESPAVCAASTCSVIPPGVNLTSGNYRWWLRTWNAGGYGPWSSGLNFTVGP